MSVERMEILTRMSAGLPVLELKLPTLVPARSNTDLIISRNTYENECWAACAGTEVAYPGP